MNLTITKSHLLEHLAAAASGIQGKTTLPVLANVLLETTDSGLRCTGTDLDIAVVSEAPADVKTPGAVTAPAKRLAEIVRELEDGPITLTTKGDRLQIRAGDYQGEIPTLAKDEFPALPTVPFGTGAEVAAATLRDMIDATMFCTSSEESRPILNGVYWKIAPGAMTMVATDGHRLAKRIEQVVTAQTAEVIVPPKALAIVQKLATDDAGIVVAMSATHIGFKQGALTVLTRLIEGPYPNYEQVIPKDNNKVAIFEKAVLTRKLRSMAVLASDQTKKVVLSLNGVAEYAVDTPDMGRASDKSAVDYDGDPLTIGFNVGYMLDVLKHMPTERVRMTFKAPERAMTIEPLTAQGDVPAYTTLIMPLRVTA